MVQAAAVFLLRKILYIKATSCHYLLSYPSPEIKTTSAKDIDCP